MEDKTDILIENNLVVEKRDLNVYHRADRGVHLIGSGSSCLLSLRTFHTQDYITLSVAIGPGYMERKNVIDLPSWLNYEFLSEGRFAVRHSGNRTFLAFPAGLPEWKLKLSLSPSQRNLSACRVTVSDDNQEQ
jgi:hypothetical protein